ncbi:MAG: hypothetical protein HRU41_08245 [Saprospiraceae bacterium]|nr:hypothetical protein [Saprospiraceae bacterium]
MIIVIVEHFLNEAGRSYFPAWVGEVEQVLQKWPGFINIQPIKQVEKPETTWLLLRFENLPFLKAWAASSDHQGILDLLEPYRKNTQRSQIFDLGNQA